MLCGIDPGKYKIGFAAAEGDKLLFSAIIPAARPDGLIGALMRCEWPLLGPWLKEGSLRGISGQADIIFLGDGTSSGELGKILADARIKVRTVNEYGTTLLGRKLYFRLHPPRGIMRLIPISLRTPPRDIDDMAAWAVIIRGAEAAAGDTPRRDKKPAEPGARVY